MRLFLLGFMGCGKSYSGKRLAEGFGINFLDLDEYLEAKEGRTIREIFEAEGEDYFRIKEKECLQDMAKKESTIISVGGGTPCFFDNMEWMNQHGVTIFLETPVEVLAKRLMQAMENRPLLKGFSKKELTEFIENKLKERNPFYHQAHLFYEQKEEGQDVAGDLKRYLYKIAPHSASEE